MNNYFTSDWHIGHFNCLRFDQRPFRDLDHMHSVLVNNYNSTVQEEDTCYFLGDVGLAKGDTVRSVLARLNGSTKVLVLGNHDKGANAMRDMGFDLVLNMASLTVGRHIVTMTHCPLRGVYREDVTEMKGASSADNWHGEHKNGHFSIPDFGQFHLHGHIHAGPANDKPVCTDRQFDVGVPGNNYRPVSMSTIEGWIHRSARRDQSRS